MDPFTREEANIVEGDKPWLLRNIVPLCAVALLVAAVIIGILSWNLRQSAWESEARFAIMQAASPAEKVKTAESYLGSEEAALALLEAASQQYDNRDYASAIETYNLYLQHYPKHLLRPGALLGRGLALIASAQLEPAIQSLQEATQGTKDSVYRPAAMFELAQAYAQSGKKDLQVEVLTKLSEDYATSLYGRRAIELLAEVNRSTITESAETNEQG